MQLSSPNWWHRSVATVLSLLLLAASSTSASEDPANVTSNIGDIESPARTSTVAPRNSTLNEVCEWGITDCESNQVCRLRFDQIDVKYRCSCDDVTSWDEWRRECMYTGITQDLMCTFSWQCASNEVCEYVGGNSRCKCDTEYSWDEDFKECRPRNCYEYCNWPGYSCQQGICTYYSPPPTYENEYSSVPVFVIFGMFVSSMLVVCCVWKCAMRRRLRQMHAGPASIVVVPTVSGRQQSQHTSNAPTTPDDPPKYSNLQPPIWMLTEARAATTTTEVRANPVANIANAQQQQATAPIIIDAPPPYEAIASPIPPRA